MNNEQMTNEAIVWLGQALLRMKVTYPRAEFARKMYKTICNTDSITKCQHATAQSIFKEVCGKQHEAATDGDGAKDGATRV